MEEGPDQSNPCAICLSGMGPGGGQAIFTAECSHTFHFQCISASVAHGNLVCPLCNARWRQLPFQRPAEPSRALPPLQRQTMRMRASQPPSQPPPQRQPEEVFDDDDEPVEPRSSEQHQSERQGAEEAAPGGRGTLVVRTHTEYSAIARGSSHENFAALVHVKAPGITPDGDGSHRAPLDLVTVLDVSGSMTGEKLALLKQAVAFVIDNLGPCDRLSVVSFSSAATRVTRLLRMSDTGKSLAKNAVESLAVCGGTNIAEGLRMAAKVLGERRHRNAVASVILLSDGQDNYTMPSRPRGPPRAAAAPNYEALVPGSFTDGSSLTAPIHTFGLGSDHDASAMHVIAETTGGTFSFIENEEVVQDSFAQCIGGLLTVVVQEARVAVECVHRGVRVTSVKSGRYESSVDEDGRSASIRVGELYADEERRFLLFLSVPPVLAEGEAATTLIRVSCSYRDAAGGGTEAINAAAVVRRPEQVALDTAEPSVEVARERVRVEATEDIAAARAAAERGAFAEAVGILEKRERAVAESEAAIGGDSMRSLQALRHELHEMLWRVASKEEYTRSGQALMLSGLMMHSGQRANSGQLRRQRRQDNLIPKSRTMPKAAAPAGGTSSEAAVGEEPSYATPAMRAMLQRSRRARQASAEQQATPPDMGEAAPGSSGA